MCQLSANSGNSACQDLAVAALNSGHLGFTCLAYCSPSGQTDHGSLVLSKNRESLSLLLSLPGTLRPQPWLISASLS